MTTILKLKKRQVGDLMKCAKKVEKAAKKLSEFIEDELFDDEEMDERNGGGMGSGRGGGNFRDEDWDDDDDDDEDDMMHERRGVPGTGRYGRRRYGRRRY